MTRVDRDLPEQLARHYDVVVVGAGISGVCIARESAARGKSVLLLDKGDFGSGTSSKTTKYLHGGIRYLEQYDVALVRESLRERRRFALAAPHLVDQRQFILPVWKWTKPGRALLGAGALTYDMLAFDRNRDMPQQLRIGHPTWFSAARAKRAIPWLQPDDLHGAVVITDTLNVHPERLLMALVLDAISLGAVAINHAMVTGFDLEDADEEHAQLINSVEVTDTLTGRTFAVRTRSVINAAGPWLGEVLKKIGPSTGPTVRPSKGVHVITKPQSNMVDAAVMARARSGRHVVVSPWQGRYLIGPTDTPVNQHPDDVLADRDDVDEILSVVNDCRHRDHQLEDADVDDVIVGLRPLIDDASVNDPSKLSRRHHLHDHAENGVRGLYSIFGGKWTTGRAIAEDVANALFGELRSPTLSRPAAGTPEWAADPSDIFDVVEHAHEELELDSAVRSHLTRLYGTRAERVLEVAADDPELCARVSCRPQHNDILAQVVVAIADEGARTLDDIVQRRLVIGTLGAVQQDELTRVASIAAPLLGWSDGGAEEVAKSLTRRQSLRSHWASK